jgi:hypothetical protein
MNIQDLENGLDVLSVQEILGLAEQQSGESPANFQLRDCTAAM